MLRFSIYIKMVQNAYSNKGWQWLTCNRSDDKGSYLLHSSSVLEYLRAILHINVGWFWSFRCDLSSCSEACFSCRYPMKIRWKNSLHSRSKLKLTEPLLCRCRLICSIFLSSLGWWATMEASGPFNNNPTYLLHCLFSLTEIQLS